MARMMTEWLLPQAMPLTDDAEYPLASTMGCYKLTTDTHVYGQGP